MTKRELQRAKAREEYFAQQAIGFTKAEKATRVCFDEPESLETFEMKLFADHINEVWGKEIEWQVFLMQGADASTSRFSYEDNGKVVAIIGIKQDKCGYCVDDNIMHEFAHMLQDIKKMNAKSDAEIIYYISTLKDQMAQHDDVWGVSYAELYRLLESRVYGEEQKPIPHGERKYAIEPLDEIVQESVKA